MSFSIPVCLITNDRVESRCVYYRPTEQSPATVTLK